MTAKQIDAVVDRMTGADLDREIAAFLGPDRGRVRADWLNRVFGHRAGGVCIVFKF